MNIVLCDDPVIKRRLLPLTYTRPVGHITCGIFSLAEKWERLGFNNLSFLTDPYLSVKFPTVLKQDNFFVNGCVVPDRNLVLALESLQPDECFVSGEHWIACRSDGWTPDRWKKLKHRQMERPVMLDSLTNIFRLNGEMIRRDFESLNHSASKVIQDPFTKIYQPENIFVADGVRVEAAVLNASTGPIYLGKNSWIQEGSVVRGPFALGEDAVLNMGTKVRGDTTIGRGSKVGGEISNSVVFEYSNKAHDGYLGNAVVGSWCNLGAGTTASNLKNNFQEARLWDYNKEKFVNTGSPFCGLIMGDHCRTAIQTTFNSATSVGIGSNIFGAGFPRTFIPSFTYGGPAGFKTYELDEFFASANAMMARRSMKLTDADQKIFYEVFELTSQLRHWK
ncbi:MAG: glucose-1-phosphate thymidylyltransferase [Bacteroidetes bacterium]|nr:glucose-1-phosphate thymidylyltransferase [Bacteroidota bacterium]